MYSTFVGDVYKLTSNWLITFGPIQFKEDYSDVLNEIVKITYLINFEDLMMDVISRLTNKNKKQGS